MVNVPYFEKPREIQISTITGTGGNEFQINFNPVNHLAILTTGIYDNSKARVMDTLNNIKSAKNNYEHYYIEGGLGYYFNIGKKGQAMYAMGIGRGMVNTTDRTWTYPTMIRVNAETQTVYIQPSYSLKLDYGEIGFASKVFMINYFKVTDEAGNVYQSSDFDIYLIPGINYKIGNGEFKFQIQAGYAFPIRKSLNYDYNPWMFSVGFHVNITRYGSDNNGWEE
ncbi:MAG: hypothetical protein D6707_05410 [Bacteroidetes bacterium]|nr:MAG: hypothetical protein D6707_05410 [Bacteroidota bacterium]